MKPIIIKKYSNRRLYHTEKKCYITLDQVAQVIRDGETVKIIDNESKQDITQEALLQIIMSISQGLFSSQLLHDLIRLQREKPARVFRVLSASWSGTFR